MMAQSEAALSELEITAPPAIKVGKVSMCTFAEKSEELQPLVLEIYIPHTHTHTGLRGDTSSLLLPHTGAALLPGDSRQSKQSLPALVSAPLPAGEAGSACLSAFSVQLI